MKNRDFQIAWSPNTLKGFFLYPEAKELTIARFWLDSKIFPRFFLPRIDKQPNSSELNQSIVDSGKLRYGPFPIRAVNSLTFEFPEVEDYRQR